MQKSRATQTRGRQAARIDPGGMAAEVRYQHMLNCFQRNAMNILAHTIELVLGKARVAVLRPARQAIPCLRLMGEVTRSPRSSIPVEFACGGRSLQRI
jgi:hypothetical protein